MERAMTESLGRLLAVDDEAPVLEVLSEYFSTQGYAVETASTGPDALEAARRFRPDLVLLDIRMPGMDGVEVLKKLRELDPSLAVIMVTANEDMALARETLKIGAFDYVAKPFDFRYLDRAVSAALVQGGGLTPVGAGEPVEDSLRRLALQVFRTTRTLSPTAGESTGRRLEDAVLEMMREATAGRSMAAAAALAEIELLAAIAVDLGDLAGPANSALESALAGARKALSHV
jgi:two-component system, response regulator, stage 0 sporulation protein F